MESQRFLALSTITFEDFFFRPEFGTVRFLNFVNESFQRFLKFWPEQKITGFISVGKNLFIRYIILNKIWIYRDYKFFNISLKVYILCLEKCGSTGFFYNVNTQHVFSTILSFWIEFGNTKILSLVNEFFRKAYNFGQKL